MNNKTIKLLAIEDNPGDLRLIQEMLGETDSIKFDIKSANRFSAGLEHIKKGNIDVILLDLTLPDTRGLETFTSVYEKASEIPIVILSGVDDESTAIKAVINGAQDYLIKGKIDSNLLVRAIRYAIERKKAERMMKELQEKFAHLKKMAAMGTLTGGIAHKINNPLTIILTNIQLIREKLNNKTVSAEPQEIAEIIDRIENASQRAAKIISDLLFYTRDYKFELKPLDIKEAIKKALSSSNLNLKEIEVVEDYAQDLPQISGNFDKLIDGFENIIKNACEAMLKGGVLKIEAKKKIDKKRKGEFVEINFIDNGCGIPDEKLERVFDPFFSTKEMQSGLGLSITHEFVKLHNGTIAIESYCPEPLSTPAEAKSKKTESRTKVTIILPAASQIG